MRRSDHRWLRESEQRDLATRMIAHEARTKTIMRWTGLSKYQIQLIFREYPESGVRHRGVSPFQPAFFARTQRRECESAALAAILLDMRIITEVGDRAAKELPALGRGERLLDAFELFQHLVPGSDLQLEHAVLLATELVRGELLTFAKCVWCSALMVVDKLGTRQYRCGFCRSQLNTRIPDLER